jgi:hypothetical protein
MKIIDYFNIIKDGFRTHGKDTGINARTGSNTEFKTINKLSIGRDASDIYVGCQFNCYNTEIKIDKDLTQEIKDAIANINSLINKHDYKSALKKCNDIFYDKALKFSETERSTVGELYLTMASCHNYLSEFDNAFEFIKKFEENFSKTTKYYSAKAIILFNSGNVDDAVLLLDEILPTETYSNSKLLQLLACSCFGVKKRLLSDRSAIDYLAEKFTEEEVQKLDKSLKTFYEETLSLLSLVDKNYDTVIELYKTSKEQGIMLKINYIRALFEKKVGSSGLGPLLILSLATDIDFRSLDCLYKEIVRVGAEVNQNDHYVWERCIGEIIYYCEWHLGKVWQKPDFGEELNWKSEEIKSELIKAGTLTEYDIDALQSAQAAIKDNNADEIIKVFWSDKKISERLLTEVEGWLLIAAFQKNEESEDNIHVLSDILNFYEEHGNSLTCRIMNVMCKYSVAGKEDKEDYIKQLFELSEVCQSPYNIWNIVFFLTKNKYYSQALNIIELTFQEKRFMFDIISELWYYYYKLLLEEKAYSELCSFADYLPENMPSENGYHEILVSISLLKGDLTSAKKSARKLLRLNPERKSDLLMSIAAWDLYAYNLDDFDRVIEELSKIETREKEKIQIEILKSHSSLLKCDSKLALEQAQLAKELAKDLPASPAHQNLARVCMKTGDHSKSGIAEYVQQYPTRNDWVKTIHINLEEGVIPKELEELAQQATQSESDNKKQYKAGKGVSVFMSELNWSYRDVKRNFGFWRISNGDNEQFRGELSCNTNQIVVDHLSLYLLSDIDALEVLNSASKILISYSTVRALVESYFKDMSNDPLILKILGFIKNSEKISIMACKNPFADESLSPIYVDCSHKGKMLLSLIDSIILAKENRSTYIFGDINAQHLNHVYKSETMSVFGYIKKLYTENKLSEMQYTAFLESIIMGRWDYLNINSRDLYLLFKKNDYLINDFTREIFRISVQTEISSAVCVILRVVGYAVITHGVNSSECRTITALAINALARRYLRTSYHYDVEITGFGNQQPSKIGHYGKIRACCCVGIAACLSFYGSAERENILNCALNDDLGKYGVFAEDELNVIYRFAEETAEELKQLNDEFNQGT